MHSHDIFFKNHSRGEKMVRLEVRLVVSIRGFFMHDSHLPLVGNPRIVTFMMSFPEMNVRGGQALLLCTGRFGYAEFHPTYGLYYIFLWYRL